MIDCDWLPEDHSDSEDDEWIDEDEGDPVGYTIEDLKLMLSIISPQDRKSVV